MLTIITVCFNAARVIEKTLLTALEQTFEDYEIVVIDGESSDNTMNIVHSLEPIAKEKKIIYRYISEPDKGIYDAMNKGVCLADGEWVLFLNAGDTLARPDVLERFAHTLYSDKDLDFVYGNTILKQSSLYKVQKAFDLYNILDEMVFCHQSVFNRRSTLLNTPYDTEYAICADYNFYLKQFLSGSKFLFLDYSVAIYDISGFSSKNDGMDFWKEKYEIQFRNGIITEVQKEERYNYRLSLTKSFKHRIRKKIPIIIFDFYDSFRKKKEGWVKYQELSLGLEKW